MRKFNPEKELKKIQHGNKNKIMFAVIALLIIIGISSSYALYQVRYSKRIIYTKVAPFSNKDIQLAVYLDGTQLTRVPEKGTAYYDSVTCDNDPNAGAKWDYDKWKLKEFNVSVPNKCNINFTKNYRDKSGANAPELYQGLIPIYYDTSGKIYVANLEEEWYDYDKHNWANAVLVDNSNEEIKTKYFNEDGSLKEIKGTQEIPIEEILQMYVWIPRYKYQLFNVASNGVVNPQEIKLTFESGTSSTGDATCNIDSKGVESCVNADKDKWFTHPAFTFGDTELKGIWVGKFETSGSTTDLTIKPSIASLKSLDISTMFNASRNIEHSDERTTNKYNLNKEEVDTHMMKNMEWGVMAYLTQSKYGRCINGVCTEVALNGRSDYITGYNGTTYTWDTTTGQLASTTGNQYGIYDTDGGSHENMISVTMIDAVGSAIHYSNSGFTDNTMPDSKYYDLYEYDTSIWSLQRGHLGDATRETLVQYATWTGAWYSDCSQVPAGANSWFTRGGTYNTGTGPGIFSFGGFDGSSISSVTFRIVLTAQDGTE